MAGVEEIEQPKFVTKKGGITITPSKVKPNQPSGMVVGIPMRGGLTTQEWGFCLALQNYPMNTNRIYPGIKRRPVDEARNRIVRIAREENAKYIWFLDDDVGAPNYAVRKLVYDLEQSDDDTLMAGGIYECKAHP